MRPACTNCGRLLWRAGGLTGRCKWCLAIDRDFCARRAAAMSEARLRHIPDDLRPLYRLIAKKTSAGEATAIVLAHHRARAAQPVNENRPAAILPATRHAYQWKPPHEWRAA